MISKTTLIALMLTFCAGAADAAKFDAATRSSPAQILIEHALIKTSKGTKHATIRLIAKDNQSLHESQVYQAQIISAHSTTAHDGIYDEADEVIFVPHLLQNGIATHQITLSRIKPKTLEFAVIETTPLSTEKSSNMFFDQDAVHDTGYNYQDR